MRIPAGICTALSLHQLEVLDHQPQPGKVERVSKKSSKTPWWTQLMLLIVTVTAPHITYLQVMHLLHYHSLGTVIMIPVIPMSLTAGVMLGFMWLLPLLVRAMLKKYSSYRHEHHWPRSPTPSPLMLLRVLRQRVNRTRGTPLTCPMSMTAGVQVMLISVCPTASLSPDIFR